MGRPLTGQIIERETATRGTVYGLRIWSAGRRVYVTLGSSDEGFTRRDAEELARRAAIAEANATGYVAPNIRQRGACFMVYMRRSGRQTNRSFKTLEAALEWREKARGLGPNPAGEFLSLCEMRIDQSERNRGEALPHLYLLRSFLQRLYAQADEDAEFLWKGTA
jgi:hypothetical protein